MGLGTRQCPPATRFLAFLTIAFAFNVSHSLPGAESNTLTLYVQ